MTKLYAERDIMALDEAGDYYCKHVSAMTGEKLHSKSDIAAELAHRDYEIDKLKAQVEALKQSIYFYLESDTPETESERWVGLHDLLKLTPAQCLASRDAEIKAQAGREGYVVGWQACMDCRSTGVCLRESEYFNQLREQAKELNNGN